MFQIIIAELVTNRPAKNRAKHGIKGICGEAGCDSVYVRFALSDGSSCQGASPLDPWNRPNGILFWEEGVFPGGDCGSAGCGANAIQEGKAMILPDRKTLELLARIDKDEAQSAMVEKAILIVFAIALVAAAVAAVV